MDARANEQQTRFGFARWTALAAVALLILGGVSCATDNDETALDTDNAAETEEVDGAVDPISVEMLTGRAEFTDDVAAQISFALEGHDATELDLPDASRIAVARITVQPEARFPWHTHPGPVLVTVAEGEFVYVLAADCVEHAYAAGTAFVDPGGENVHMAFNPSTTDETVVIAVFLAAPADPDEPLTVPVDDDEQEALNEQCEM